MKYTLLNGFSGDDSRNAHGTSLSGNVILSVVAPQDNSRLAGNPNPGKLPMVNGDIKLDFRGIPNRAYEIERWVELGRA
jgi:hypothetical protein